MDSEPQLDKDDPSLLEVLKETTLLPVRVLLSKPALKTYLSTILLALTASIFYLIAIAAYLYLYYNYIPNLSFSVPVHLQFSDVSRSLIPWFDSNSAHDSSDLMRSMMRRTASELDQSLEHPYGISPLTVPGSAASALVSQQRYDFSARLTLPRTPSNIDAGNFMLNISLLGPTSKISSTPYAPSSDDLASSQAPAEPPVLATSTRPTTLTYTSPHLQLAQKAATLPLYLTGLRSETETLLVPLMEGATFDKGWRHLPKALRLEVQSTRRLQIYSCEVFVRARLAGARWVMYNYRILAFLAFTSLFWSVEMGVMVGVWVVASLVLPSGGGKKKEERSFEQGKQETRRLKKEEDDSDSMSDTSRSFPTSSRQPPLHYSSSDQRIKREDDEADLAVLAQQMEGDPQRTERAEADADVSATDTDEDADFVIQEPESIWRREREKEREMGFRDSGFGSGSGTGSASGASEGLARRRGR